MTKEECARKIKDLVDNQTMEISQDLNLHETQTIQLNTILAYMCLTSFNWGEVYGKQKDIAERPGKILTN